MLHFFSFATRSAALLWASPWSSLGLIMGAVALATGGKARRKGSTLEFHGGAIRWLLNKMPTETGASAMTLGHVILGQNVGALDYCREHELVHVRQYERWGPLFLPAYLLCSAFIWVRGGNAYRDNPFEREAYRAAP